MRRCALLLAAAWLSGLAGAEGVRASEPRHGLSVFGDLKYPADFEHFDYVNPDAPKGGSLRRSGRRTFFSLQPFIRQGNAAGGMLTIYDTLLTRAWDEPSALYGLLAGTVELADDRSWVEFVLRPEARWHDGKAVTADDVVFTVEILKEKGSPTLKSLLREVTSAEKRGRLTVRIHMTPRATRQLPLQISSEMRILPKHYWATREFDKTTLEPPLGSGPYKVAEVDPGRSNGFERVRNYWARNLNVNVGRFNFDHILYRYFLDNSMQVEAIKGHELDWKIEFTPKVWATGYEIPAKQRGHLIQETMLTERPVLVPVRIINLRMEKFQDPRVREALTWAYNQEWTDQVLFFGILPRSRSYFQNSDLEHRGPPSAEERALLEPFRDQLDPRIFDRQYEPPVVRERGRNRENLLIADRLLNEAGWVVRNGVRVHAVTGEPYEISFLLTAPAGAPAELSYADSLRVLGIDMTMRSPFTTEYQRRVSVDRDFDMILTTFGHRLVPGAELENMFGSRAADRAYSRNTAGIKVPAVDFLIEKIMSSRSRAELLTATLAIDLVLCWSFVYMHMGQYPGSRYAYWNIFGRPEIQPRFATGFPHTWWIDPVKREMVASGQPIEIKQAAMH